jgi:hypothetical protein
MGMPRAVASRITRRHASLICSPTIAGMRPKAKGSRESSRRCAVIMERSIRHRRATRSSSSSGRRSPYLATDTRRLAAPERATHLITAAELVIGDFDRRLEAVCSRPLPDAKRCLERTQRLRHHGQTLCKTSNPKCGACVLRDACPSARVVASTQRTSISFTLVTIGSPSASTASCSR